MDVSANSCNDTFATVGDDRSVRIWRANPATKSCRTFATGEQIGELGWVDNNELVSVSYTEDNFTRIRYWDYSDLPQQTHETVVESQWCQASFCERGILVGCRGVKSQNKLRFSTKSKDSRTFSTSTNHLIHSCAISSDGSLLGYGEKDIKNTRDEWPVKWPGIPVAFYVHDVNTNKTLQLGGKAEDDMERSHMDSVIAASFSPEARYVATTGRERSVKLWELSTGNLLFSKRNKSVAQYLCLAFSPNGKLLAIGDGDGKIDVRRVSDGELAFSFQHNRFVAALQFMPDGKTLVTSSYDKTIKLWDIATQQLLATFETPSAIRALAIFSDGGCIAAADSQGNIHIWEGAELESQNKQ